MTDDTQLGTWHEIYSADPDYKAEGMANDIVHQIAEKMDADGVSRSELAESMKVHRAYVSKILNAPPNLTLRSIAAVAIGLGIKADPKVILDPTEWIIIDKNAYRHVVPIFAGGADTDSISVWSEALEDHESNLVRFPGKIAMTSTADSVPDLASVVAPAGR